MGVFDKLLGGKCEKCGRGFAVKKSEETLVMREDIKTESGQKGERLYYRTEQSCKFCGDSSVEYIKKDILK